MIFYFSSTGNTRWAAQEMGNRTQDRLVNIADALKKGKMRYGLHAGEHVGFIFPVHGWRPPMIVREFISKVLIDGLTPRTYVYALCTAGDSIGMTMDYLSDSLKEKGMKLCASFSLIMPESYIGLPFMYLDKAEGERRKRLQASVLLEKYAGMIGDARHGDHLHKGATPYIYSKVLGGFFYGCLITDSHFKVDEKKCTGCSLCSRVCPVDDIVLGERNIPEWQHNDKCMTCFSCLHHCPENAIEWGWFTKGKGQYLYK